MHAIKIYMKSIRHRKVFQAMCLMLFLGSASAAWLLKDAGDSTLATASAIIFSLFLLESVKSSANV